MRSGDFTKELEDLLNRFSWDNETNVPDYILARFLVKQLASLRELTTTRDRWFGFKPFSNIDTELKGPKDNS